MGAKWKRAYARPFIILCNKLLHWYSNKNQQLKLLHSNAMPLSREYKMQNSHWYSNCVWKWCKFQFHFDSDKPQHITSECKLEMENWTMFLAFCSQKLFVARMNCCESMNTNLITSFWSYAWWTICRKENRSTNSSHNRLGILWLVQRAIDLLKDSTLQSDNLKLVNRWKLCVFRFTMQGVFTCSSLC